MSTFNLSLKCLSKTYESQSGPVRALSGLTFDVHADEIVSIVGPSGCGKTTLLNIVAGFVEPTTGCVDTLSDGDTKSGKQRIAVVFQEDSVFPWMTVAENVGYALRFDASSNSEKVLRVLKYLHQVGLEEFAAKWPRELSGGMKKRVDLARAYTSGADILLLDEPFGFLDVLAKELMQVLLLKIWQAEKKTILFVTHDVEEALFVSSRIVIMTPRPGSVRAVIDVPFAMPRNVDLKLNPAFVNLRKTVASQLLRSDRDEE